MGTTMRIGFDVSPLTHPHPPGVRRVTEEMVGALERRGNLDVIRLAPEPTADLLRWRQWELPRMAARLELAGIHSPVSAFALAGPGLRLQTVHELPWKHGVAENAGLRHRFWAGLAGRRAAAVCVPTELVARDLGRPRASDGGRVHVCPWAAASVFTDKPQDGTYDEPILERYRLPDTPFLLAPGAVRAKKNLAAILAGLAELTARGGGRVQLVITGPDTADLRRDLGRASQLGIGGLISTLGPLPDVDLAALMRLADAVLVLSTSEGFGLPALEAAACGTAVIVGVGSAPAEVLGPAAIAVDADRAASLADAIELALGSRGSLGAGLIERAAHFSWDRAAATVEDIWMNLS